jgi:hypothetical protein
MIRPLRRVHRAVFVVLAVLLPLLLALSVLWRHPAPINTLPADLDPVAHSGVRQP